MLPEKGTRWIRSDYNKSKDKYNGYTVLCITNIANVTIKHPPQVIYKGDNGHMWSLPLSKWPGRLIPEPPVLNAPNEVHALKKGEKLKPSSLKPVKEYINKLEHILNNAVVIIDMDSPEIEILQQIKEGREKLNRIALSLGE